jgi:hypothetical protein
MRASQQTVSRDAEEATRESWKLQSRSSAVHFLYATPMGRREYTHLPWHGAIRISAEATLAHKKLHERLGVLHIQVV